jgi:hypothetical protein
MERKSAMRLDVLMDDLTSRSSPSLMYFFKFNNKTQEGGKNENSRNVSFENRAYQKIG